MAFNFNENMALSRVLFSKKNPSGLYSVAGKDVSYEALNVTLQNNMKELTHGSDGKFDYYKFQENSNTIYQLLSQTLTEIAPKNVWDMYGQFADVQTIGQGDKIVFTKKIGRQRALSFITRVALASRYEVFELAEEKYEIQMLAIGAGARIGIEEFLDGRVQWSDYLEIINEGMSRAVYQEIAKALTAAIAQFPATNKVSWAGFDETQFDRLIATVSAYGTPAIYGTYEALAGILPANNMMSDNMKDSYYANGRFATYKGGVPMIVLPQSFVDETNTVKVVDPRFIYIFPTNGEKPVKIVFEGKTLVKEFDQNSDWSTEMHTYQKFGVGILTTNNLAVYANTDLSINNVPGPWTL